MLRYLENTKRSRELEIIHSLLSLHCECPKKIDHFHLQDCQIHNELNKQYELS